MTSTNPKDALGRQKLPLHLVPSTAIAYESLAFLEGAAKYGAYNWRSTTVRSDVYVAACLRHLFKWADGEDCDPVSGVPHLGNARACLAILIDAAEYGTLRYGRDTETPKKGSFLSRIEQEFAPVITKWLAKKEETDHNNEYLEAAAEAVGKEPGGRSWLPRIDDKGNVI